MTRSRSLTARAVMALLLMAGFYLMALGISGALVWVPYAEWTYLGRVHFKIAAMCLGAAGAVLWSVMPRADRFEPPGPQLTPANAPRLFRIIHEVARATAQESPSEVYLLNEVNAWVTHRGGVMGLGSRRVMGVGLPLLAHLSVDELKAVIAHEFGHYVSGDVSLGPWIHKTRSAIGRAVAATHDTFLEKPFQAYGRLFLKTTLTVSREQEFVADRTAAQVAGTMSAVSALRRVATLGPAYSVYFNSEVLPVLRAGFMPPIAGGFQGYLAAPGTAEHFDRLIDEPETDAGTGEFDSHPPMADRIKALNGQALQSAEDRRAVSGGVLADLDRHAEALLRHNVGDDAVRQLQPITWDQVGTTVYERQWHEIAGTYGSWFGDVTVDRLPVGQQAYIALGSRLVGKDEVNVNSEERIARAAHLFTAGLGSALSRAGWSVETGPGRPIELVKGAARLEPVAVVARLVRGDETEESWRANCDELQIASLPIAEAQV